MTMKTPAVIRRTAIKDIRAHYEAGEGPRFWFSPATMAFFKTRFVGPARTISIETEPLKSFFITSEQAPGSREFTIRSYDWVTREIESASVFSPHQNRVAASVDLSRLTKEAWTQAKKDAIELKLAAK